MRATCKVCKGGLFPLADIAPHQQLIGLTIINPSKGFIPLAWRSKANSDAMAEFSWSARSKEIQSQIAAGINPYSKLSKAFVGDSKTASEHKLIPGFTPPMDKSPWHRFNHGVSFSKADIERLDLDPEVYPTRKANEPKTAKPMSCSFCGITVEPLTATEGIGPSKLTKITEVKLVPNSEPPKMEQRSRWIQIPEKLTACPNCCLNIRPVTDLVRCSCKGKNPHCKVCNGSGLIERTLGGVKFPETEG